MSRTAARIRQADLARVIRAAKQAGAGEVRILTDGTITVTIPVGDNQPGALESGPEVVL